MHLEEGDPGPMPPPSRARLQRARTASHCPGLTGPSIQVLALEETDDLSRRFAWRFCWPRGGRPCPLMAAGASETAFLVGPGGFEPPTKGL